MNPHIGPLTKVILLKLFLDIVPSSSVDITRAMRGLLERLSRSYKRRNGGNAIVGLLNFADPQSMDYPIWTTKWTTLMDSQMDYLDGLPIWTT